MALYRKAARMTISNRSIRRAFNGFDPDDQGGAMLVLFRLIAENGVSDPADNKLWRNLLSTAGSYGQNPDVDADHVNKLLLKAMKKIGQQSARKSGRKLKKKPRKK